MVLSFNDNWLQGRYRPRPDGLASQPCRRHPWTASTTLARHFVSPDSLNYFDLEEPQSLARLAEPATTLRPLKGLVVIDEIQRQHPT
jgi:hypothetical protein